MPSSNVTVGAVIEVDPPAGVVKIGNTYWKTTWETRVPSTYSTDDIKTYDGIKYYNRGATGALQNLYVGTHYRLPTYAELQELYSNIGETKVERFNNIASTTGWTDGNGNNTLGLNITPVGYVHYSGSTPSRYGNGYVAYIPCMSTSKSTYEGATIYVRESAAMIVQNDNLYQIKDAKIGTLQYEDLYPVRLVWDPDHLTEAPT